MAHSSLIGTDDVPTTPKGRDSEALGPSDSSDSGSDVAGLAGDDGGDPSLPLDAAVAPDVERPETSFEVLDDGSDSDAAGTGERRSAGSDAGVEAADISPDRVVFDPNTGQSADGALDELMDDSPRPERGADAPLYASAATGEDEDEDVEPPPPGGTHPKAHARQPSRRERDHGLSGPEPDMPARTPPPVNDPFGEDEGTNDEGDDTVVVPKKPR
ncbi:MAG TPA: hypothetical protein VLU41_18555 [Ideonella sp.]|nr:hypothetical protein [Ideonella sp.]